MLLYRRNEHTIVNQLYFTKMGKIKDTGQMTEKRIKPSDSLPEAGVAELCFASCLVGSVRRLAASVAAAGRGQRNRSSGLTCEMSGARPDGKKGREKEERTKMSKRTIKQRKWASLIAQLVKYPPAM